MEQAQDSWDSSIQGTAYVTIDGSTLGHVHIIVGVKWLWIDSGIAATRCRFKLIWLVGPVHTGFKATSNRSHTFQDRAIGGVNNSHI